VPGPRDAARPAVPGSPAVGPVCACPQCPGHRRALLGRYSYRDARGTDEALLLVPWGERSLIVAPSVLEFRGPGGFTRLHIAG
jgi:hypothetical protein